MVNGPRVGKVALQLSNSPFGVIPSNREPLDLCVLVNDGRLQKRVAYTIRARRDFILRFRPSGKDGAPHPQSVIAGALFSPPFGP